jgi:hypothetical protein
MNGYKRLNCMVLTRIRTDELTGALDIAQASLKLRSITTAAAREMQGFLQTLILFSALIIPLLRSQRTKRAHCHRSIGFDLS